ncbi:eukaryotic translation initiation factor 2b, subunit 2, putative [Plasmodium gallinaceum]|uniref:Translation initiation factor eIF2B subunit beta n=1 Tax=Plasmodium gallinaceum TaxID=5849 RepID=A0A1J1GXV8_PLAGA|nr:eukaryotic translation initiation factor 2b, subunit 2, putative [Plasmodium gallinaceum]CRG97134.1 eukaryotic translation initiation factor 2b, subunit 2, putative [Plasmodium gallinaceum]
MDLHLKKNYYEVLNEVMNIKKKVNSNFDLNEKTNKNNKLIDKINCNNKDEIDDKNDVSLDKSKNSITTIENNEKKDLDDHAYLDNSDEIYVNNYDDNYTLINNKEKIEEKLTIMKNESRNNEIMNKSFEQSNKKNEVKNKDIENKNENNSKFITNNFVEKEHMSNKVDNKETNNNEKIGSDKNECNKEEIKFEKKKKKSEKLKKERQNEIMVAYWLKGIINILNEGFRSGDIKGSHLVGRKIVEVLKKVVEISQWNSVHDLIEIIKYLGKEIIKNNKMYFVIPNIIRRVLTIIRTEHFKQLYLYNNNYIDNLNKSKDINNKLNNKSTNNNLIYEREIKNFERSFSLYFENTCNDNTYKIPATNTLKHSIIEGITELMAEIDISWEEAEQRTSYDLFMENDVILTLGYSVGVERFLKTINKKKDGISVIVVGGDINRSGFRMAKLLSEDGVDTTYISDSAVFAVIPKVTKVVLGSVAVSSSGGAITKVGGYNIACSAQFNCKPVTIVLPLFKLIYVPLYDPLRQNELQPGPSMIYNDTENLYVRIPKYDYIPEHLITLYITEMGPVDSFQLYNITKKKYHPDDLDLSFD